MKKILICEDNQSAAVAMQESLVKLIKCETIVANSFDAISDNISSNKFDYIICDTIYASIYNTSDIKVASKKSDFLIYDTKGLNKNSVFLFSSGNKPAELSFIDSLNSYYIKPDKQKEIPEFNIKRMSKEEYENEDGINLGKSKIYPIIKFILERSEQEIR